ncbi:TonB-dependent receptor domain-containing protein [Salinimicrobium flavum]|uniref:TonB-dependent receptor domain-containing protein n=1 Tax=Salinimicrobium flavum TaxID=1737065 RepID=A0ABW5IT80_9FLAO
MIKNLLLFTFLLCFGSISAQTVNGTLMNSLTNQPVTNASVSAEGASAAVLTAEDGSFSISVLSFPVLLKISAEGFEEKKITIENAEKEPVIYLLPLAETLSEVVLRSTVIPKELLRTPASVSVLNASDLKRSDETNIVQTINTVSGVYIHQGALNTNKISIRGIGARAQYGTNRVKAYFEGIPISTAEGETTIDDIDPAVIGRIEILKGPVSSVYGAGLGGVINMYAARATQKGSSAKVRLSFGSYGLFSQTVQASHATENTDLVATYNGLSTDSFRENGEYDRKSFTLSGKLMDDGKSSVSLLAQLTRLKAYIPSSVDRETLENDPASAAFTWAASRGYESYDRGLLGLSFKHRFSKHLSNTTSTYLNFRDGYEPRPFDILNENRLAAGARTQFNWNTEIINLPSEISLGAEYNREWYAASTFDNLYENFSEEGSIPGDLLSNNTQDRYYTNLFAQWNLSLTKKLLMEAGLNLNSTRYELTDQFYEDETDQSGKYRFESVLSPRAGVIYSPLTSLNLYATVSHGFSTPSVAETLTPEGLINTELKPETGINYEVGFKGNFFRNKLYAEIAAFSIQVNDLLVAKRVAEDRYIGRNIGKTDHNGIEFLLQYNFSLIDGVQINTHANASFNDFSFDEFVEDEKDLSGNALPAVPDKSINAGLDISFDFGFDLYASFQHEGEMPLNDENSGFTEDYNLFHLKAVYTLNFFKNWDLSVFGGVNNVFDENYAASIVPNAIGFGGASPRYFYPGNPRNYFGGFSVSYLF